MGLLKPALSEAVIKGSRVAIFPGLISHDYSGQNCYARLSTFFNAIQHKRQFLCGRFLTFWIMPWSNGCDRDVVLGGKKSILRDLMVVGYGAVVQTQ